MKVKSSILDIGSAVGTVEWESGAKLSTFVNAEQPLGWFKFEDISSNDFKTELLIFPEVQVGLNLKKVSKIFLLKKMIPLFFRIVVFAL